MGERKKAERRARKEELERLTGRLGPCWQAMANMAEREALRRPRPSLTVVKGGKNSLRTR